MPRRSTQVIPHFAEPLYANPVLFMLAPALACGVFRNYKTYDEIFAILPPSDGTLHHLQIANNKLKLPFFQTMSRHGPTEKIQQATSFGSRLVTLGHRAGYPENIKVHDIRREALVKADDEFFYF